MTHKSNPSLLGFRLTCTNRPLGSLRQLRREPPRRIKSRQGIVPKKSCPKGLNQIIQYVLPKKIRPNICRGSETKVDMYVGYGGGVVLESRRVCVALAGCLLLLIDPSL